MSRKKWLDNVIIITHIDNFQVLLNNMLIHNITVVV
jgi:hypothetical protein